VDRFKPEPNSSFSSPGSSLQELMNNKKIQKTA